VSDNLRGYSRLKGPIDWLINAGLLNKVKIANRSATPIEAFCSENIFKLYLFDVGILGCALDLSEKTIVADDYGISKGYFAESFVCQALSSSAPHRKNLYAWSEGQSEVEFLKVVDNSIIPIEVKAGRKLQAKSLASFRKRYAPPLSVKLSKMHLHYDDTNKLLHVPLYLAGFLDQLIPNELHKTDAH
jgi:predicted AAA+ superfamily ATPase